MVEEKEAALLEQEQLRQQAESIVEEKEAARLEQEQLKLEAVANLQQIKATMNAMRAANKDCGTPTGRKGRRSSFDCVGSPGGNASSPRTPLGFGSASSRRTFAG